MIGGSGPAFPHPPWSWCPPPPVALWPAVGDPSLPQAMVMAPPPPVVLWVAVGQVRDPLTPWDGPLPFVVGPIWQLH